MQGLCQMTFPTRGTRTMNLYLVRHADARPAGEQGITVDEDRPLSEDGLRQARALGQALKRLGITLNHILTSPLRRAVDTAGELARGLQLPPEAVQSCNQLSPDQSSKKLAKELLKVEGENLLLVGHEPDLGQHTAWLMGSKKARVELAKGAVACVECDGAPQKGAGALRWLLTPKVLTALSSSL
jgi:phosphohistidine phosphatase